MKKFALILALTVLAACTTIHPAAPPNLIPPQTVAQDSVQTVPQTSASDESGGIIQRWITHTTTDFERLGVVAKDEPIGAACSVKGLALMAALPSATAPPTGYFLTDTETAKLAQRANIVALGRAVAQACIPLVIGPEKFWGAIGMPKAIQDIINGGGGQ